MNKVVIGAFIPILLISVSMITSAENTKFKQQIVPIDCIYEVIDVGTQKLRYLTPETCPVDPGPPVVTEPPDEAPTTGSDSNWVYNSPIAIVTPVQNPPEADEEVAGSIEEINDVIYKNQDAIAFIFAITLIWWIAILTRRHYQNKEN